MPSRPGISVDIIIPSYNRADLICTAVEAALNQSWRNKTVTVVDDGSSDGTGRAVEQYFTQPGFNYIKLARNHGTAGAKNAGLLLTGSEAVTFHDSDDLPHPDKVKRQAEILMQESVMASPMLNWSSTRYKQGERLDVSAALTHHELRLPGGEVYEIRRTLSLVDDVFPNLQMGSVVQGDWTHVNSGLFRAAVFARHGGFADSVEEDREFRNRLVLGGEVMWIIPEILLTKFETHDSLTASELSGYASPKREEDRRRVWDAVEHWRETGRVLPVPVHAPELRLEHVSNPKMLRRRDMPATSQTRRELMTELHNWRVQGDCGTDAAFPAW